MLEPFTLKRLLLLEGGELALQRHAFVVDAAPVLRYNRVGFCIIGNRQRLQDWHQGVNTFLNRTVLGLFSCHSVYSLSRALSQALSALHRAR